MLFYSQHQIARVTSELLKPNISERSSARSDGNQQTEVLCRCSKLYTRHHTKPLADRKYIGFLMQTQHGLK